MSLYKLVYMLLMNTYMCMYIRMYIYIYPFQLHKILYTKDQHLQINLKYICILKMLSSCLLKQAKQSKTKQNILP